MALNLTKMLICGTTQILDFFIVDVLLMINSGDSLSVFVLFPQAILLSLVVVCAIDITVAWPIPEKHHRYLHENTHINMHNYALNLRQDRCKLMH